MPTGRYVILTNYEILYDLLPMLNDGATRDPRPGRVCKQSNAYLLINDFDFITPRAYRRRTYRRTIKNFSN